MAYNAIGGFPQQRLPYSKKTKAWRKKCIDFGDDHSLLHYHLARKSVFNMKINYDLLNGKIHMSDFTMMLNPYSLDASFIPDSIQHYPIINSKLKILSGEESKRIFDYRLVVINPTAITEMEEEKNRQVNAKLQELMATQYDSMDEFSREFDSIADYFQYHYQDKREIRGNFILNQYTKELEMPQKFNAGFTDAYTVGEEAYLVDIVGGDVDVQKLDPMKLRIIRSEASNRIEDADIIVIEDYWSPGMVIDTYWDQLSDKDIDAIENATPSKNNSWTDSMDNIDPRYGFVPNISLDTVAGDSVIDPYALFDDSYDTSLLPYDLNGNVRVLRVFWKSRRKIKKVKSYDPETGEEVFNFYPETYHCKPEKGEEEDTFWINEAWEGTKIANDIYVNMRPRPVQYNRLSNPSRCHFGIIGSIYNINSNEPFSMVDIMKPYSYLYDVIHDRLNKTLAKNQGKVVRLDLAKVPTGWDVDKWMYYITSMGVAVEDSFKEGDVGRATGVLAGGMNNATSGIVDASLGTEIQQYISLLEWISNKIGEIAGISKQREGQVSNRETVGGVERATLQSSYSTEWLFFTHDSVKKRVLECILETAKIALKGRKKKFSYILSDGTEQLVEIDGDEFAECDYGLILDNSNSTQELNQKLEMLAQAALQNQLLDFSTIMKLYSSSSIVEKQRMVEINERKLKEMQQQQQQQQMQIQQQQLQQQAQLEQLKMQQEYKMNQENNETKILVAQINSVAEERRYAMIQMENGITKDKEIEYKDKQLDLSAKQFSEKLALDKKKHEDDVKIKKEQINKRKS